jgi:hypothetical protein
MKKIIRFSTIIALVLLLLSPGSTASAEPDNPMLRNSSCLMCHGRANFSMPGTNGEARDLHVEADSFTASVHGSRDCVSCHEDISQVPHQKGVERQVGCVRCHQQLWAQAQENGTSDENARLGEVVGHIDSPGPMPPVMTAMTLITLRRLTAMLAPTAAWGYPQRAASVTAMCWMSTSPRCTVAKPAPVTPMRRCVVIATLPTTLKKPTMYRADWR